jgi:hypothetical protein
MAVTHGVHSLSNSSATRLTPNGTHSGMDITIQNLDSGNVYLGGEGVTTTNFGIKLPEGSSFSVELNGHDAIYAISDTDGNNVSVITFGLEK